MRSTRRGRRSIRPSVMHVTNAMNSNALAPVSTGQAVHIFALAGGYVTAGTALTTARETSSNREQECTIGSHVGKTIIDFCVRSGTTAGKVEYVVIKIERTQTVPAIGTILPANAVPIASGMQTAYRQYFPGRVLKYGQVPFTPETATVRRISVNWAKFGLGTVRAGDYYCIVFYNQGITGIAIDVTTRYKEYR